MHYSGASVKKVKKDSGDYESIRIREPMVQFVQQMPVFKGFLHDDSGNPLKMTSKDLADALKNLADRHSVMGRKFEERISTPKDGLSAIVSIPFFSNPRMCCLVPTSVFTQIRACL